MSDSDPGLSDTFTRDHRRIDAIWAELEATADGGAPEDIAAAWRRFAASLTRHLDLEEQLLFPAFETKTGITEGPTRVMRMEHDQMRGLLAQMQAAVDESEVAELLDLGDTLLLLIQQHNQKEEHMLYPMSEKALVQEWSSLRAQMERYPEEP